MKLFLFGGAEIDLPSRSVPLLKNLIKETLVQLEPSSILLVPFARLHPTEEEWKEGWFKEVMQDTGIKIFDARNDSDIDRASDSVIFINGGSKRRVLIDSINKNVKLLNIIKNAKYIVSESSGSMIMGEYMLADRGGNEIIRGVGVLKNTVIEPHYTERKYQQALIEDMRKSGVKYGIGIDSATAIVVDPQEFPDKWEKIGVGNVYIKTA